MNYQAVRMQTPYPVRGDQVQWEFMNVNRFDTRASWCRIVIVKINTVLGLCVCETLVNIANLADRYGNSEIRLIEPFGSNNIRILSRAPDDF